jgi:hypothetical protein
MDGAAFYNCTATSSDSEEELRLYAIVIVVECIVLIARPPAEAAIILLLLPSGLQQQVCILDLTAFYSRSFAMPQAELCLVFVVNIYNNTTNR